MTEETAPHPLAVRFASARNMFLPELSDAELRQINEIATAEAANEISEIDINRKITKEFGLEARHQARLKSEDDIDGMTADFKEVIVKWGMLKMVDPLVVAGSVINHLNGLSAVMGCYIEDLMKTPPPSPDAKVES
jgi:sulfite reductase beta subunit-like hemoprotein